MRKKCILLLCVVTIILTGCWDSIELNDIAVVTGIALDPGEEHNYRMTVGYINPRQYSKQSPEQGAPITIMTLEGDTLPEIAARMNIGVSRKLVFSHTRVLYINEKVAEKGIATFLDSLDRSPQFRNDFNILITRGNEAKKFPMMVDQLEKVPSMKVQKQIEHFVNGWGGAPKVRLSDIIDAIVSKGRSPVASVVTIQGNPEKGKNFDATMSTEHVANVILDGMGVFDKDRLIGVLTIEDARGYLWTQEIDNTVVSIPCEEENNKDRVMGLVITNSHIKLQTEYEGDTPQLKVNIYGEARINSMECVKDLTKMEVFEEIEKKAKTHIEKQVTGTIEKVQKEYGVDIFGFGEVLNRQNYKKAKEVEDTWDEEFKKGEVNVNVEIAVRRSGIRNKGFLDEVLD